MKRTCISARVITMLILLGFFNRASSQSSDQNGLKKDALIILQKKCNVCHASANPGKVFSDQNMDGNALKIYRQVFIKRRMPKGGIIKLTEAEEQTLRRWLQLYPSIKP